MQILKDGDNVQVTIKEGDNLWGLSFILKEDNSEEIALLKEHLSDEEIAQVFDEQ